MAAMEDQEGGEWPCTLRPRDGREDDANAWDCHLHPLYSQSFGSSRRVNSGHDWQRVLANSARRRNRDQNADHGELCEEIGHRE
jgi:hypothetical protein